VAAALPSPVRVCGRNGAANFLANLHCPDGRRPIDSAAAAEAAHAGLATGRRGACGSTVDRYRLRCGSDTLEVDLDLYWCPKNNYFDRNPYTDY